VLCGAHVSKCRQLPQAVALQSAAQVDTTYAAATHAGNRTHMYSLLTPDQVCHQLLGLFSVRVCAFSAEVAAAVRDRQAMHNRQELRSTISAKQRSASQEPPGE
jgi:hypothetical protein